MNNDEKKLSKNRSEKNVKYAHETKQTETLMTTL